MKKGRVVILTCGRQAGKKAVIVKQTDEGKKVSSLSVSFKLRTRSLVTLSLLVLNAIPEKSQRRWAPRNLIESADWNLCLTVKYVNYNHLMPTRFVIKDDLEFKNVVTDEKMGNPETRKAMKAEIKKIMQAR